MHVACSFDEQFHLTLLVEPLNKTAINCNKLTLGLTKISPSRHITQIFSFALL